MSAGGVLASSSGGGVWASPWSMGNAAAGGVPLRPAWAQVPCVPQVVLIVSGNLSFLNWLTIVPSLACFDDATLAFLFPSGPGGLKDRVLKMQEEEAQGPRAVQTYGG